MGAGILPVCIYKSQLLFLFGKDTRSNLWSDFGGSSEIAETNEQTAIREGAEELNGFLGSGNTLENLVNKNKVMTLLFDRYTIYVFKTNYDKNLPLYFNNNYNFMKCHLNKEVGHIDTLHGLFEKKEIKWFTCKDLIKNKNQFRLFYRPIIDIMLKEYDNLYITSNQLNNENFNKEKINN